MTETSRGMREKRAERIILLKEKGYSTGELQHMTDEEVAQAVLKKED